MKKGRITLFAEGVGVGERRLKRSGKRPRYFVSDEEAEYRRRFWREHNLDGKTVVAVQMQAAEQYRDYPKMNDLVRRLARNVSVIFFHSETTADISDRNIIDPGRIPIRLAFALVSGCSAVVAPDSAFVHLAGALDIPCILLSGPVDGRVRSMDYARCTYVDVRKDLKCVPCWRNELIPCKLTGMRDSACMCSIQVEEICMKLAESLGMTI